ncbi:conserved hypothetical protein [Herpetosiphon aurantiacus DSM 785]|uniref:Uncharacterized protein n=1 Tax=Herpetosiphon aurantiacus (strain ATCC 23779 / DSM 785 / 114-95) TaxID=316274 RepID=A9AVK7_HERA2|nr:conserved hypothetical protein [Herpetosiphon aurantiacus DSM 785]
MNQDILAQTLLVIQAERIHGGFNTSSAWVDRLVADAGEEQLAERLDAAIGDTWPWEVVADLFGLLTWQTSDNGADLSDTTDDWLREGTNLRRIQIALHGEAYPFHDRAEMVQVLEGIAQRFPEVADRCEELITSRNRMKD